MKENESALFSRFIIDGIQQDATPYEILSECMADPDTEIPAEDDYADILDESTDPPITSFTYYESDNELYIKQIAEHTEERAFRMLYPETFTRQRIAKALLDRLWNFGHFRLGDLRLWGEWEWNSRPLGNMAAFYTSAQAASEYIYDLGCRMQDYSYDGCDEESSFRIAAWIPENDPSDSENAGEYLFKASPYESRHPWIKDERICPETMSANSGTQIIYIPFDTSPFRLGGSLLAEIKGHNGGVGPHIQDPDYFIDCYEVVRELVEDGVIISGTTVMDGGIAAALQKMCGDCGININISGIMSSYMEDDTTRILFSEIPGIIIQVEDSDLDYLDSQLILQDVAYYNLGKPTQAFKGIKILKKSGAAIVGILASLLDMASEGED